MKLSTLVVWSVIGVFSVGCGGGGSRYKITSTTQETLVVLSAAVQATGDQDVLDSMWLAMAGAGCQAVKARYEAPPFEMVDVTCSNIPITFSQKKGDMGILASCPVATGVPACEAQFVKVLDMARDARYIK